MDEKQIPFYYNVIKSKMMPIRILDFEKANCKQQRRDLLCNHNDGDLFTCEDMKFSHESSLGISLVLIP